MINPNLNHKHNQHECKPKKIINLIVKCSNFKNIHMILTIFYEGFEPSLTFNLNMFQGTALNDKIKFAVFRIQNI